MRFATSALAVVLALASGPLVRGGQNRNGQGPYQQGNPSTTNKGHGGSVGALAGINGGASTNRTPEGTAVSLDTLSTSPGRFENHTLGRRVGLYGEIKQVNGVYALVVKDSETGKRIDASLHEGGITFIVTDTMADRLKGEMSGDAWFEAVAIFTVTKLPTPGAENWIAVVSRVSFVGPDGSVTKTVDAE